MAQISHVINYDMPDTPVTYIHRIGRTGRATRTGTAWTLVTHEDAALVGSLAQGLGVTWERRMLPGFAVPRPPVDSAQTRPRLPRHAAGARRAPMFPPCYPEGQRPREG